MWSSWCLGLRKNSRWRWQCEQSPAVEGAQSSLEKEVTAARVKWRWGCRIKDEASCCWWWCYELWWGSQNSQVTCSIQLLSCVWLFATPWTAAHQASLSITNSWSLPKLMSIESVIPSNHLILCRPLLLPPSNFPSIRVFSKESALCIMWPKYWSFSFNISPSNEYPGLVSFRMDWLDLLSAQETLKNLLQHHSSKASILRRSAFFIV